LVTDDHDFGDEGMISVENGEFTIIQGRIQTEATLRIVNGNFVRFTQLALDSVDPDQKYYSDNHRTKLFSSIISARFRAFYLPSRAFRLWTVGIESLKSRSTTHK